MKYKFQPVKLVNGTVITIQDNQTLMFIDNMFHEVELEENGLWKKTGESYSVKEVNLMLERGD